jgi:fluoride ion exporter CrcB/FEX
VTGFLGAYTTYSTFTQETYHLGTSHLPAAVLNVALSVVVG